MNRIGDTLIHFGPNEEIVRAFVSGGVEFLLVGGLAMSWYCSDRKADDMDLLIHPTTDNSTRLARALDGLKMQNYRSDSFTKLGLQVPLKEIHYADILTPKKEWPSYPEIANDAVHGKLFHIPISIASAALLIRLKEHAVTSMDLQRDSHQIEKHLKDIERLKKISGKILG